MVLEEWKWGDKFNTASGLVLKEKVRELAEVIEENPLNLQIAPRKTVKRMTRRVGKTAKDRAKEKKKKKEKGPFIALISCFNFRIGVENEYTLESWISQGGQG